MPAKIVISRGDSAGEEFWIEDEVVRLGSGPRCELRMHQSGIPEHLATLEYLGGQYVLYNRSPGTLYLGEQDLESGSSATWPFGLELGLDDHLSMRLVVEGDPAPAQRPRGRPLVDLAHEEAADEEHDEEEDEDEEGDSPAGGPSQLVQIAVILVCVLACALMMMMPDQASEPTLSAAEVQNRFEAVIQALEREADDDPGLWSLRTELQIARIAELREESERARESYGRALDLLNTRRDPEGKLPSEATEEAWDFALTHLRAQGLTGDVFP